MLIHTSPGALLICEERGAVYKWVRGLGQNVSGFPNREDRDHSPGFPWCLWSISLALHRVWSQRASAPLVLTGCCGPVPVGCLLCVNDDSQRVQFQRPRYPPALPAAVSSLWNHPWASPRALARLMRLALRLHGDFDHQRYDGQWRVNVTDWWHSLLKPVILLFSILLATIFSSISLFKKPHL